MTDPAANEAYRPCVGVVLINHEGDIFTARRKDTPDAWQMPQGGLDPGEEPREAALRELREETGITAVTVLGETENWLRYDLPTSLADRLWNGRYRGQQQKWFACRFDGLDQSIDLQAHTPEFDAWRWSSPDQVLRDIVGFKKDVYRTVLETFRPHLKPFRDQ